MTFFDSLRSIMLGTAQPIPVESEGERRALPLVIERYGRDYEWCLHYIRVVAKFHHQDSLTAFEREVHAAYYAGVNAAIARRAALLHRMRRPAGG